MPGSQEIYEDLNDTFFKELASRLQELPSYKKAVNREDSFLTAEEIKQWSGLPYPAKEIDAILLDRWAEGKLNKIRPAKYPHQTKLVRLWGHTDNLWPLKPDQLQPYRNDEIVSLPHLDLPATAPNIFVSFNSYDKDLAVDLRKQFANWGWQAWLYLSAIKKGANVFIEVNSAIRECRAAVITITFNSIGSAWVYSEFQTLTMIGKPICGIFNTDDRQLLNVLETWKKGEPYCDTYSESVANVFIEEYKKNKKDHHAEGYETTISAFLKSLSFFSILALYPRKPVGWNGSDDFIDFTELKNKMNF